jgi:ligand-binding sensor domain-containing protein
MLLMCCSIAFAQDLALDVSQYAHTAWRVSEGFAKGVIRSLAQTPDGYLWVGTDFGLLRFDGVRAVPWQPPPGEHLPGIDVRRLLTARDGRLWIGASRGLASWKDGKLTHYPELEGQTIQGLLEDREGAVWVGGWKPSLGRLCRIQSDTTQCYGEDGRFGNGVTALQEDREGNLWAGGITGLWRWKPGSPRLYPLENQADEITALSESDDGGILVARRSGITELTNRFLLGCRSHPSGCYGIAMAACGSERWWTWACCISTREERNGLPQPTACQAVR